MPCFFCFAKFELNTIKYNTVININNKTVYIFCSLLVNVINILIRITKDYFDNLFVILYFIRKIFLVIQI